MEKVEQKTAAAGLANQFSAKELAELKKDLDRIERQFLIKEKVGRLKGRS